MPFGFPVATPRVTTGNVRTTYDPYTPSPTASSPGPTPSPFNGLACPLGTTFLDQGGADSVSGTTTQLPTGQVALYKYVLYKRTAAASAIAAPGVVYYTDNTGLIVTPTFSEGITGTSAGAAGLLMINTTDLSTITDAILQNGGNGSGVWICIGGFVKAASCPGSTAVGDYLIGASGAYTLARIAQHATQTCDPVVAIAYTALSASNTSDVKVQLVPLF